MLSDLKKGKTYEDYYGDKANVMKEKRSLQWKGKSKETIECPNCGYKCPKHLAKRWHFDNCKNNNLIKEARRVHTGISTHLLT